MTVEARVLALLRRKGHLPETDADPAAEVPTDPLAAFSAEAVSAPARLGRPHPAPIDLPPRPRTARRDGFSLHADLFIHANDREGLERICRYGLRPAVAVERLSFTGDGRVRYRMKRTFAGGTREVHPDHRKRSIPITENGLPDQQRPSQA